jgi:UDP-N-acetylglucosamine:LPS N-acetylglucosamine transferase
MEDKENRILILTGDAGLGHRSAAEAVQKAFEEKYGAHCEGFIDNPLNDPKVPDVIRKSQSDYDEIVKKLPDLYKIGYTISDSTLPVSLMEAGFIVAMFEVIRDTIKKYQPDLVISTYPVFQAPIHTALVLKKKAIPSITVITDLTKVHHVWFNKAATRVTAPTDAVRWQALQAGLSPDQIIVTGIPVNPRIMKLKQRDKTDLRESLGWDRDLTSLLVVGSPRIKTLIDTVRLIDHSGHDLQMALVAGGNDTLYESFQQEEWHHPVKVYNFVDNMPELMRAADLILCKAGGLIVTESLASGLPLLLVHALPGQEIGNVNYVVDNNAGRMCQTPDEILETLYHWLDHNHALLDKMAKNAESLIPIDAAFTIADLGWDLLNQPSVKVRSKEVGRLKELLARFNISL